MAKKYIPKQFSPRIYAEWGELYSDLTDNQMAELLKAITKFPNYDIKNVPVWGFIKSQLQKDYDSFVTTCRENSSKINNYWGERQLTAVNHSKPKLNRSKPKQKQEHITETEIDNINKKFDFGLFEKVMNDWLDYKKDRKEKYQSDKSIIACFNKLKKMSNDNPDVAREIIDDSIARNYAGFFELKKQNNKKTQGSYNNYSGTYGEDIPL